MNTFKKITLFTDTDGRARFRDDIIEFTEGEPRMQLTPRLPASTYQFRYSPVGFTFDFHIVNSPIWVAVLQGQIEIILRDGTSRIFGPGDAFYAADVLPDGVAFDPQVHGHQSRQVGPDPLVTLFTR